MYTLYGFFTQNTLKVAYVLEELGVPYNFKFVNLLKGENKQSEFLTLTPVGKVPVLLHEGQSIFESGAICRYVANVENSVLYPKNPLERAHVDQWLDFFSSHLGRWLTIMYFEKVFKTVGNIGPANEAKCTEALQFVNQFLPIVETWLQKSQYFAGSKLSIADLCAYAYVEQALAIDLSLQGYPYLSQWLDTMACRSSIKTAQKKVTAFR